MEAGAAKERASASIARATSSNPKPPPKVASSHTSSHPKPPPQATSKPPPSEAIRGARMFAAQAQVHRGLTIYSYIAYVTKSCAQIACVRASCVRIVCAPRVRTWRARIIVCSGLVL